MGRGELFCCFFLCKVALNVGDAPYCPPVLGGRAEGGGGK